MKVFVLAAGYATRLYPLTRDRAKPLLEVGGKPILSRILERVLEIDAVSEVVVIGNSRFAAQLADWASGFVCRVPLRVLDDGTATEATRLGAVGDLAFALREVPLDDEELLVIAGDNLLELDLQRAYERFRERGRPMLLVRRVDHPRELSRYSEVTLDADGNVTGFREKPADPREHHASIAAYFLTRAAADLVTRYLAEGGNPDAPGYFIEWLVQQTPVVAMPLEGRWFDIGSLETLDAARAHFDGGS